METVETFTGEPLKSGGGEKDWLRFFVLMSSWIAHREGLPAVPVHLRTPIHFGMN